MDREKRTLTSSGALFLSAVFPIHLNNGAQIGPLRLHDVPKGKD